jgi:hypothetical protein
MSANDIRELEEMNLIPEELGGNKYMVNAAMMDMASVPKLTGPDLEGGEKENENKKVLELGGK